MHTEVILQVSQDNYDILLGALYENDALLGIEESFDVDKLPLSKTYEDIYLDLVKNLGLRTLKVYLKNSVAVKNIPKLYTTIKVYKNKSYIPKNDWHTHFKPVKIGKFTIQAPWEPLVDKNNTIVIKPGMAFGTGIHETTQLVIENLLQIPVANKTVLDIGTGTGILSIITSKLGASKITGIDIDKHAIEEARQNASINNTNNITFYTKDLIQLGIDSKYDIILANIISGILIKNKETIVSLLNNSGILVLSGILTQEKSKIFGEFKTFFKHYTEKLRGDWYSVSFVK